MLRRLLCVLLLCAITVPFFSSCKETEQTHHFDHTHEAPVSVNLSTNPPKISTWQDPWYPETELPVRGISKERIATLFGAPDAAECTGRSIYGFTSYITNYFETIEGDRYGFRDDNNAPVYVYTRNGYSYDETWLLPELEHPRDSAIEAAKALAADLIDLSLYDMTVEESLSTHTIDGTTYSMTIYRVLFHRPLGDLPTTDRLSVSLNSKGAGYTLRAHELGAFEHLSPEQCTKEAVEKAVAFAAAQNSEGRLLLDFAPSYKNSSRYTLCLTPNGEYVLSDYWTIFWQDTETGHIYRGLTPIAVVFGKKPPA